MDRKDRRRHPRFEGQFPVEILNTGDDPTRSVWESLISGQALDVSRTGLRLQTRYTVPVGSAVSVLVYHRGASSLCLGTVVWRREVRGGGFLYGLYIQAWTTLDRFLAVLFSSMEEADVRPADSVGSSRLTGHAAL